MADPATTPPATPATAPKTQWGVVDQAEAPVLAGPSRTTYVTGKLAPGSVVEVLSIADGFAQIRIPGCCAAWVAKKEVQLSADGSQATAITEGACLAAGLEMKPTECTQSLRRLKKGEVLSVLAVDGDFIRVDPPADTVAYVQATLLRSATEADKAALAALTNPAPAGPAAPGAASPTTPASPATASTTAAPGAPKVTVNPPATVAPVKPVKRETANDPALRATEDRAKEALAISPMPAKVAAALQAEYAALAARKDLDSFDSQLAAGRAKQFDRLAQLSAAREQAEAARKAGEEAGKTPAPTPPPTPEVSRGHLEASGIYTGQQMPRLLRLVDSDGITLGYLKAESVDAGLLGQNVEIEGTTHLDAALQVRMIQATRITPVKPPAVETPASAPPETK